MRVIKYLIVSLVIFLLGCFRELSVEIITPTKIKVHKFNTKDEIAARQLAEKFLVKNHDSLCEKLKVTVRGEHKKTTNSFATTGRYNVTVTCDFYPKLAEIKTDPLEFTYDIIYR